MNRITITGTVIVTLGIAALYYGLWSGDQAADAPLEQDATLSQKSLAEAGSVGASTEPMSPTTGSSQPRQSTSSNDASSPANLFPSPDDWLDVMEFHQDEVAWGGRDVSEYRDYTHQQLLTLVDAGDLAAIKEMAYRYGELRRGNPVADMDLESPPPGEDGVLSRERREEMRRMAQKHNKYIDLAIVYGDRELLSQSRQYYDAVRLLNLDELEGNTEALRALFVEGLAHIEFTGMRGMRDTRASSMYRFVHQFSPFLSPDQITAEDRAAALQRAQEIYDQWEQKRFELGLGPFDNSVPDGKAQEMAWAEALIYEMIEEETDFQPFR